MILEDPVRKKVSILATERTLRPHEGDKNFVCPFCPGNENLTPPEILRIEKDGLWIIRVVPNKYPFCETHEVIIESPDHRSDIDSLDIGHMENILGVWKLRLKHHSGKNFVLIFRNYGKLAGASIAHPHSQLVALDFIPEVPKSEMGNLKRGSCKLCNYKKFFLPISEGNLIVSTPKNPYYPMEIWVFPGEHVGKFEDYNDTNDLAKTLKLIIKTLKERFSAENYNVILHTAPKGKDYHWHIEIIPRKGAIAGFEMATGVNVVHYRAEDMVKGFSLTSFFP